MAARPASLALAVGLLIVIAASSAFLAVLLAMLAAGVGAWLYPGGGASALIALVAAASAVAAIAAGSAALGLWRGRAWGWVVALAIALVTTAGAVVAVATSGGQLPVIAGLALTGSTLALLLTPSTRSTAGLA